VTAETEEQFRYLNFTLQVLMTEKLMFKCAEYLAGRNLTTDLAKEFMGLQTEGSKLKAMVNFLIVRQMPKEK